MSSSHTACRAARRLSSAPSRRARSGRRAGPATAARRSCEVGDEVDERLLLLRAVVRPEGAEARLCRREVHAVDLDETEEVLEAPVVGAALGPQRVALEVEEDVARRSGPAEPPDRPRVDDLGARRRRRGRTPGQLEPGLLAQPRRGGGLAHVGHRLGRAPRARRWCARPRRAGGGAVAVRTPATRSTSRGAADLGLAHLAATAGEPARVAPGAGPGLGPVLATSASARDRPACG